VENPEKTFGKGAVDVIISPDEYPLGTELVSLPQGHARVDTVLACLVGSRGRHSPLMGKASYYDRFALESGIEEHLDRRKKGIDIDVDNTPALHLIFTF